MQPQIISAYEGGIHNKDAALTVKRLEKSAAYKDLSTIVIIPAHGMLPTRVAAAFRNMFAPPNQKCVWLWALGQEVGEAYSNTIAMILGHPELSTYKYILTIEHDNLPPADAQVSLLARMEASPEFAAIGGLYFTKGPGGQPQIWGNPLEPMNFKPQPPRLDGGLAPCIGTGMGFTMYRLSMFKDPKLRRPWFKSTASAAEGVATQDLYFANDAFKNGYRFAVDCSVKVGHYDYEGKFGPPDTVW